MTNSIRALVIGLLVCACGREPPEGFRGYFHNPVAVDASNFTFHSDGTVEWGIRGCDFTTNAQKQRWEEVEGGVQVNGKLITRVPGGLMVPRTVFPAPGDEDPAFWAAGADCVACEQEQTLVACEAPSGFGG